MVNTLSRHFLRHCKCTQPNILLTFKYFTLLTFVPYIIKSVSSSCIDLAWPKPLTTELGFSCHILELWRGSALPPSLPGWFGDGESTQRRNEKCFAYYFGVYLERVARERGDGDSEPIKNLKPQFFIFSKQLQYWIVLVTGVIYHVATYENTILSRKNM